MKSAAPPREQALFWTFAVAAVAALLVAFAARIADHFLSSYETETANYAIVRVLAPDDDDAVQRAEDILKTSPGVAHAARMSQERASQMLRDAGADSNADDMPNLRLIELRLEGGVESTTISGDLSARLSAAGISADVLRAPPNRAQRMISMAPTLLHAGAIGFVLVLSLIAGLTARGLAGRRADVIQVMADLGASRGQTAKRVGDEAGAIGFGAGLLASVLVATGAFCAMLLLVPGADISNLTHMVSLTDLVPLALAPFLSAFVAASGARAATDSLYAEAARLA